MIAIATRLTGVDCLMMIETAISILCELVSTEHSNCHL